MSSIKQVLLATLTLFAYQSTYAHDFEIKSAEGVTIYFDKTSDNTCEVTHHSDFKLTLKNTYSGNITIPSLVVNSGKRYNVTSIGKQAFRYSNNLKSVKIPNTVTDINDEAFGYCYALQSVEIPNSVVTIGNRVFENCRQLSSIEIPNSVTSIGSDPFFQCTQFPVENGIRYASVCAIEVVDKTLSTYTFKEGTRLLCGGLFSGCQELTWLVLPNSIVSIGNHTFTLCQKLEFIDIPNSVVYIGSAAFSACSNLISIELPNSVTSIESSTFMACSALASVTIPNSVTSIKIGAFENCPSLTSITIPNSVTLLDKSIFRSCPNITEVFVSWQTPEGIDTDPYAFNNVVNTATLYVPRGTTDNYKACIPWMNFKEIKEYGADNISNVGSNQAVQIHYDGNCIQVSKTQPGEKIELYSLNGTLLQTVTASAGKTSIPYKRSNAMIIVKHGGKAVKCNL